MTKTPEALKYFRRYSKFYLKGIEEEDKNICWRVEATDSISMPGILQVVAVEYFANETRDDLDNSLADGLVMEPVDPNAETEIDDLIQGDTFIKPKKEYTYFYRGKEIAQWSIVGKAPVEIVSQTNKKVTIR